MVAYSLFAFLAACSSKNSSSRYYNPQTALITDEEMGTTGQTNPILVEEEYEAQQRGEVTFDIPVVRNEKVEQWIEYFQGRGRKWFVLYMERSGRYVPMFRKILRDHDLPEDLVNLAMIESGFSVRAYSRARAVGPWQFMKATGRLYGLKVNFWLDERRDPEKATIAAARHLKDLYDQFQSWKLAAAAYNAGAGKVTRAIKRYRTEDFWALTKGRYLKPETRNYVPKLIAAALIAKEPEKYGFVNIEYQDPLQYDKIILEDPVNLQVLADKSGTSLEEIMALNPELNHPVTPPAVKNYELRVPVGHSEKFLMAYRNLGPEERFQYTVHTVRKGDSIGRLTRLYAIPSKEIMAFNGLKSERRLKVGSTILIPIPNTMALETVERRAALQEPEPRRRRVSSSVARNSVNGSRVASAGPSVEDASGIHVVRAGETLSSIATKYNVRIGDLKRENNLRRSRINAGQRLKVPEGSKRVHVVRRGESLALIAERYGASISDIKSRNRRRIQQDRILPGTRLVIPAASDT